MDDKLYLEDITQLEDRNNNFRHIIMHKKYDISHEDNIAKYIINNTKWKDMLLIRYKYYFGDMVFYDNGKIYIIELKSLKDSTKDTEKDIEKNIERYVLQSIKYAKYAFNWAGKEAIPITAIEYSNGDIIINEHTINNPWKNKIDNKNDNKELDNQIIFKIVGDTLEAEKIINEANSELRIFFKKQVEYITKECTICSKYLLIIKNFESDVLMMDYYNL